VAQLDAATVYEVHPAARNIGELVLDVYVIEQAQASVRLIRHQQIDIARKAVVTAEERSEQFQLGDLPTLAEGVQNGLIHGNRLRHIAALLYCHALMIARDGGHIGSSHLRKTAVDQFLLIDWGPLLEFIAPGSLRRSREPQ
jgi:hypothetical protein